MKILRTIGILVAILSILWMIFDPGFEAAITLLGSLFTYGITFVIKKEKAMHEVEGKGGHAIVGGPNTSVEINNSGVVEAGKGGTGGSGGDAINLGEGIKVKIINEGVIKGGDAGNK